MTNISFYRKNEDIVKYKIEGHTNFNEAGEDILCAAISTLAFATLNGLTDVVGVNVGYEVSDALIEVVLPCDLDDKQRYGAHILLKTLYMSLKDLKNQYKDYITITELEV